MFDIDVHLAKTFLPRLTGVSRDLALCYIMLTIENGVSKVSEGMRGAGESKEAADRGLKEVTNYLLLFFPSAEELLKEHYFNISLQLTVEIIILDLLKQKNRLAGWKEVFLSRLNEVFPPDYSAKLHDHAIKSIFRDMQEKGADHWLPEWEDVEKYYAWRKQVITSSQPASDRHKKQYAKPQGMETWMAKCPRCEVEKRVDKNTKRFRCGNCGEERSYPFN